MNCELKIKKELYYMNIAEIVKDSLRYPLSDWKKILILGIIMTSDKQIIVNRASALKGGPPK